VLDPARVRAFARALGQRAKTDPIDAALLRTFGERVRPRPTPTPTAAQAELAALQSRRRQLVRLIVAEKNHAEHAASAAAQKSIRRSLAYLEKEHARIEAAFERAVAEEPALVARLERLEQIPGVGRTTAEEAEGNREVGGRASLCAVVASAPELGSLNRRQAAALPGLAPHPRQSGPRDGQRSISGGPTCGSPSTWPRSARCAITRPSTASTTASGPPARSPKSPSPPRCENSSCS
jgi:transposase